MAIGKVELAQHNFERALADSPNDDRALIGLARANVATRRYDDAVASLRRVVSSRPDNRAALSALCDAYTKMSRYAEAEDACRASAEVAQLDPDAWLAMGQLDLAERRYDEAIDCARTAAWIGGSNIFAAQVRSQALSDTGDVDGALAVLDATIARYRGAVGPLLTRAGVLGDHRRFGEAIRTLDTIAPALPRTAIDVKRLRGHVLYAQGKLDEAGQLFTEVTERDPSDAMAGCGLARTKAAKGDSSGALEILEDLSRRDPYCADAPATWAELVLDELEDRKDPRSADARTIEVRERLERALRIDGRSVNAWRQLARLDWEYGSTIDALKTLDEAERAAGPRHEFAIERANALTRAGRRDQAADVLAQALAAAPSEPDVALKLGDLWRDAGKSSWAAECYQRASQLDPEGTFGREAKSRAPSTPETLGAVARATPSIPSGPCVPPAVQLDARSAPPPPANPVTPGNVTGVALNPR